MMTAASPTIALVLFLPASGVKNTGTAKKNRLGVFHTLAKQATRILFNRAPTVGKKGSKQVN